jgi:hypothetical protein
MVIRNHGSAPDRLLSVASPAAESVELHGNEEEEGVMRMRPLEEPLEIPAGAEVPLERGGLHVMFMGLAAPFEDGALVALTLTFEEAGAIEVEVPVDLDRLTGATGAEHDHEGHGDHGGHGG